MSGQWSRFLHTVNHQLHGTQMWRVHLGSEPTGIGLAIEAGMRDAAHRMRPALHRVCLNCPKGDTVIMVMVHPARIPLSPHPLEAGLPQIILLRLLLQENDLPQTPVLLGPDPPGNGVPHTPILLGPVPPGTNLPWTRLLLGHTSLPRRSYRRPQAFCWVRFLWELVYHEHRFSWGPFFSEMVYRKPDSELCWVFLH